jgi:hypothetical protein
MRFSSKAVQQIMLFIEIRLESHVFRRNLPRKTRASSKSVQKNTHFMKICPGFNMKLYPGGRLGEDSPGPQSSHKGKQRPLPK